MDRRKIGNLEVSAVGYGCMGLSQGFGPETEDGEAVRLLQKAYETGYTFFDTAEAYGNGKNEELGIGFVAFSPLAKGFLTGEIKADAEYTGFDFRRVLTRFSRENVLANQPLVDLLQYFAVQKEVSIAQLSLAWILHKSPSLVPIPGARSEKRIKENHAAGQVTFTEAEFDALEAELAKIEIHGDRSIADLAKIYEIDNK